MEQQYFGCLFEAVSFWFLEKYKERACLRSFMQMLSVRSTSFPGNTIKPNLKMCLIDELLHQTIFDFYSNGPFEIDNTS